jgi:hypothetical protein
MTGRIQFATRIRGKWLVLLATLWFAGCGGGTIGLSSNGTAGGGTRNVSVSVSPQRAAVSKSQTRQFTATAVGDPQNDRVTWSVDDTPGGSATIGRISTGGLYSAPATGGIHTIVATSLVDPTKNAAAAIAVGAVMTDPTGDQTITGAHALILSNDLATLHVGNSSIGPIVLSTAVSGGVGFWGTPTSIPATQESILTAILPRGGTGQRDDHPSP